MALYLTLGTILLTLLLCKIIHGWIFGKKKLLDIPGPKGWPLVGNSFQMDPQKPHETFTKWSKKFGNIFKIKIFQNDAVVLNDFESIREMLISEACSARPYIFRMNDVLMKDWNDIGFEDFTFAWNERKKALTRSLNVYGSGQMKIESITVESIENMFDKIADETEHCKRSIDMRPLLHECTTAIFTTLLYGRKLEESELMELLELERGVMKLASPAGLIAILDLLPMLRYFPVKAIQRPMNDAKKFRQWIHKKYLEMLNQGNDDQMDGVYFSLMRHVNKATNKVMTPEELLGISMDLVVAGFSTSSATLYSLILVLINNPDVQVKMHEEIDEVTKGRRPEISHRKEMPYVRAVIEENFRFTTLVPLAMAHMASEDTTISGKFIPKGTSILANMWKFHHDEKYFEDPWKFKPERYLSSDGQILSTDHIIWKHTMTFSAGRRICPGEGLARHRIFLILTNLMQKYKFLPEDEENIPPCDPHTYESGILLIPCKYKVRILER